jgi:hypothetical protein
MCDDRLFILQVEDVDDKLYILQVEDVDIWYRDLLVRLFELFIRLIYVCKEHAISQIFILRICDDIFSSVKCDISVLLLCLGMAELLLSNYYYISSILFWLNRSTCVVSYPVRDRSNIMMVSLEECWYLCPGYSWDSYGRLTIVHDVRCCICAACDEAMLHTKLLHQLDTLDDEGTSIRTRRVAEAWADSTQGLRGRG